MRLPALLTKTWGDVQLNFDAIAKALTPHSRGTGQATWAASVLSGAVLVPHGLGVVPTTAEVSSRHVLIDYAITARDKTNLTVTGFTTYNGVITAGPLTFDWVAYI